MAKNADSDQYKYSGYAIGFDSRGSFSLSDGSGLDKNVIWRLYEFICAFDNKKKDIVSLGKGPTNYLDDTTLTAQRISHKFYCALTAAGFGKSLVSNSQRSLNCVSLNNRPCQATLTHKL